MWVLPTYGRPDRCQQTLDSVIESGVSTSGVVIVDGDSDPRYDTLRLPMGWHLHKLSERVGVCAVLNYAFGRWHEEDWYGFLSDDSIVRTTGWDGVLVAAAKRDGFANSADNFNSGPRMHGAVAYGGDLLRVLGWWAPPGLTHSFCDDAWERLGRKLGNWTFHNNVLVEHAHFANDKAPEDATYKLAYSSFQEDRAAFNTWLAKDFDKAVERANAVIQRDAVARRHSRAQRTPVMICTPVYRDCSWQYTRALVDTCITLDRFGAHHRCQMVIGNSNLPRARNELVAEFLASDCATMIFIDSDMGWVPNDVLRLLSSEHEVIGAVGRKRTDAPNKDPNVWCAWFLGQDLETDDFGAIKVGGVGTGFLKIDRSAFEKIAAAEPDRKRRPLAHMSDKVGQGFYDFFRFGDGPNGECIGEDYQFCNTWRSIGNSVWIDPAIALTHVGSHSYEGSISEIFEASVQ